MMRKVDASHLPRMPHFFLGDVGQPQTRMVIGDFLFMPHLPHFFLENKRKEIERYRECIEKVFTPCEADLCEANGRCPNVHAGLRLLHMGPFASHRSEAKPLKWGSIPVTQPERSKTA